MKQRKFWIVALLCLICMTAGVVMAQDDDTCPVIVQQALDAVDTLCAGIGRNEVCYGNVAITANARDGMTNFTFDTPGDVVSVGAVESLQLQPMDIDAGTWGMALLRVQANIPDTLPGQAVTFLLFGDTEFEPVTASTIISVTANVAMNVRGGPGTDYPIVSTLAAGAVVQVSGRTDIGDWLLIRRPDGGSGWVYYALVEIEDDLAPVDVVEADATSIQAFFFRSGIGDAPCEAAPDSGLLISTPDGIGQIEFVLNEVHFSVGSTIFLQAEPGAEMIVTVAAGEIIVTADGVSVTVMAGERVRIPLDDEGRPTGPPSDPEPADPDVLARLPVDSLPGADSGTGGDDGVSAPIEIPTGYGDVPPGEAIGLVFCGGGVTVPAGQPVGLRLGWAATAEYIGPFMESVTIDFTYNGQPIDVSAVTIETTTTDLGDAVVAQYYWVVTPAAGTHQIHVDVILPAPVPDGFDYDGDGALDLIGSQSLDCTFVAEG